MTFRPDVFGNIDFNKFYTAMEFNSYVHNKNNSNWFKFKDKFITYWDNKIIEQDIRYLWSDGKISSDCEWKKLY